MALSQAKPLQPAQLSAHIVVAPLVEKTEKNVLQNEAAYLDALDALYDDSSSEHIAYAHYHQPIMMSAAQGNALNQVIEAWVNAGLFYSYNLVVLNADSSVLQHPALKANSQAQERLAVYTDIHSVSHLQAAISHYLDPQEPHVYVVTDAEDTAFNSAVTHGFLACSQVSLPWLIPGENGFYVAHKSAQALAQDLVNILDSPESDWEILHQLSLRARELQTSVFVKSVNL